MQSVITTAPGKNDRIDENPYIQALSCRVKISIRSTERQTELRAVVAFATTHRFHGLNGQSRFDERMFVSPGWAIVSILEVVLSEVFPNAAGVDVSALSHWVAVPPGSTDGSVRELGAIPVI